MAKYDPKVAQQQIALNQKGANLKVDGIFGPQTQAAITKFNNPIQPVPAYGSDVNVGGKVVGQAMFDPNTGKPLVNPNTPTNTTSTSNINNNTGNTGSSTPSSTTSGTGVPDTTFLGLMNNLNSGLQQNNQYVTAKTAVVNAMLGQQIPEDQLSKLPPDIQQIIRSGDRNALMLQAQVLNDRISGYGNSIASSIQYLTSGYQQAQTRYNQDVTNVLNYAKALNAKPSDVMKALYPAEAAQLGTQLDALAAPLLTSTQMPNSSTSTNVTIPNGTIASQTNNALNIKYSGLPGQTDSGISATDGGTFASYSSPEDGLNAAIQLLKSPTYSNLTVDQAMNQWSNYGYGAEVSPSLNANQKISSLSTTQLNQLVSDMATRESGATVSNVSDPAIAAYVSGIQNGTITSIASVPSRYKSQVALEMKKQNISSPLADTRFTIASSRITAPFEQLAAYTLTSNALPYLEKIDAAASIPGSVSDQDLLDAFTKLSTSGGVISDAQVKVITGGSSWSDTANVLAKKVGQGGVLSDNQRKQIQDIAKATYTNFKKGYQPIYDQATAQLTKAGIPNQYWTIPDLNTLSALSGISSAGGTSATNTGSYQDYLKVIGQ